MQNWLFWLFWLISRWLHLVSKIYHRIRFNALVGVAENGFMGMGIGAAMTGLRPIVEGMNMGFLLLAYNQISNNAGMLHYTSGGQFKVTYWLLRRIYLSARPCDIYIYPTKVGRCVVRAGAYSKCKELSSLVHSVGLLRLYTWRPF